MCFLSKQFREKHPDALRVSCLCGHQFSPLITSRAILGVTLILYIILLNAYRELYDYHARPPIVEPMKWICLVLFSVAVLLSLIGLKYLEPQFLLPQISVYAILALLSTIGGLSFALNAFHLPFLEKFAQFWLVEDLLKDKAIAALLFIVFVLFAIYFKFCTLTLLKCYIFLKTKQMDEGAFQPI